MERFKNKFTRFVIIHDNLELPPGIEGDPPTTSSEATSGLSDSYNKYDEYPLKGKETTKKPKIEQVEDEQL